jgi:hypothetical protein
MNIIISKDDFKVSHNPDKNQYKFKILFTFYSEELIKSITKTKIILGATTTEKYDILIFNATSVKTFDEFHKDQTKTNGTRRLPIHIISKIIHDLSIQLKYLILYENHSFLGYNTENIIVIDDNKFVYLTNEYLKEIKIYNNNKETIMVSSPFTETDFFLSPELMKIKEIPTYVHYKASYYSLGNLILYLFTEEDNVDTNVLYKNNILINTHIKGTKLYWLLERMLDKNPKNRSILLL